MIAADLIRMRCALCGEPRGGEVVGINGAGRLWRCEACGHPWLEWNPGLAHHPLYSEGRG